MSLSAAAARRRARLPHRRRLPETAFKNNNGKTPLNSGGGRIQTGLEACDRPIPHRVRLAKMDRQKRFKAPLIKNRTRAGESPARLSAAAPPCAVRAQANRRRTAARSHSNATLQQREASRS